jgi:hypothetical protein
MTSPFGLPWPTFSALLVIAVSVVISIVWALSARGGRGGRADE